MKPKIAEHITIDELRELFEIRGSDVVWKKSPANRVRTGAIAGALHLHGKTHYRRIGLYRSGKTWCVQAHHISFALSVGRWPEGMLDHKDGVGTNNNPCNLREATSLLNNWNRRNACVNTTGAKGVSYRPNRSKPFYAQLRAGGAHVLSQDFATLEEATLAVQEARTKHHGEFARHD